MRGRLRLTCEPAATKMARASHMSAVVEFEFKDGMALCFLFLLSG